MEFNLAQIINKYLPSKIINTDTEAIPTKLTGVPTKAKRDLGTPYAIPKDVLRPTWIYGDPKYPKPNSIDPSGNVCGVWLTGIWTSTDSLATFTYSTFDFSTFAAGAPYYYIKTKNKHIVILRDTATKKGAIVVSDSFDSGYVLAVTITNSWPEDISISYTHDADANGGSYIFVGEYTTGADNIPKNLWASFNNGATWQSILQTTIVNQTVNNHFHHTIYDPYMGRIWSAVGDTVNASLKYSDDLGQTWNTIAFSITNPQPTLMAAFPQRLVYAPDAGNYPVSLWEIPRDHHFDIYGNEQFLPEMSYVAMWSKPSYALYGTPPMAQSGVEAYITMPATDGSKKTIILGTADGGNSWHTVYTHNAIRSGGQMPRGIVGPDKNGFLFAYQVVGSSAGVFKSAKANWLYK